MPNELPELLVGAAKSAVQVGLGFLAAMKIFGARITRLETQQQIDAAAHETMCGKVDNLDKLVRADHDITTRIDFNLKVLMDAFQLRPKAGG